MQSLLELMNAHARDVLEVMKQNFLTNMAIREEERDSNRLAAVETVLCMGKDSANQS